MDITPVLNPLDLETILAERELDEPFDRKADLVAMGYEGEEPVGIIAGRLVPQPDGRPPLAWFEHAVMRPAWEHQGLGLRLYLAWEDAARDRGALQAVAGRLKATPRTEMVRLGLKAGWRPYLEDATREWFVRDLGTQEG